MPKGPQYERDFCHKISSWWSLGLGLEERTDLFWRTSNSGGRATVRHRKGKGTHGQYGDVCATDPIGQPLLNLTTLELKRGYNKHSSNGLADLVDCSDGSPRQLWEKWIYKAITNAEMSGVPYWTIVAKRDRREEMVVLPQYMAEELERNKCISSTVKFRPMLYLRVGIRNDVIPHPNEVPVRLIAVRSDQFFAWLNPERIAKVYSHKRINE